MNVLPFPLAPRPHAQGEASLGDLPEGVVALRAPERVNRSRQPLEALVLAIMVTMTPEQRELVAYRTELFTTPGFAEDDTARALLFVADRMGSLAPPSKRALRLFRQDRKAWTRRFFGGKA